MLKKIIITVLTVILGIFIFLETYTPSLSEHHGKVQAKLFLGESENQPLIVGFGGSEGKNTWASDYWQPTRDKFIEKGYAFLAIGYFGLTNIPSQLDRISLDAIHDTIIKFSEHQKVNSKRIAVIGGSKGGELVLNLASYFNNIDAVIAIVPSHVSFPALTEMSNTSSWTLNNNELPFVPTPYAAIPSMMSGNIYEAYQIMLKDNESVKRAVIPVENINGSVLLISARSDELWPSTKMSEKIIDRLEKNEFKDFYKHIICQWDT